MDKKEALKQIKAGNKTKAQIKNFKKLEQEALNGTGETGYYTDEFDYCLGRFAEDLCSAGQKEWARKIYKIVEEKLDRSQIDSDIYLNLAEDIVAYLGDKEWARKIYKIVEDLFNRGQIDTVSVFCCGFASDVAQNLGDKKWARKIYKEAEKDDEIEKRKLANSIIEFLGDKEWAKKVQKS